MKILVLILGFLICQCLASPTFNGRDLPDILNSLEAKNPAQSPQTEHKAEQSSGTAHASATQTSSGTHTSASGLGLLEHLSSGLPSSKETSSRASAASIPTATSPTTYSIIGTIPPMPSYTPKSTTTDQTATVPQQTQSSTPSSSPSTSSFGTSKEWKIIGVAVIAFSSVAAILLLAVFFDQWTRFVKDLFWKGKRRDDSEELVPDWKKASWDVRLGSDRHRYPSFASLPSETLMQGLGFASPGNSSGEVKKDGALGRSASTKSQREWVREKAKDFPASYPLNPQPYHPSTMKVIADQYVSPKLPTATRSTPRSHQLLAATRTSHIDHPKSPGMASIYGGIAS